MSASDFWIGLATMLLAVIVAAGAYPALVLARVRPVQALRAGRTKTASRLVSTAMVGAQFAAASFLLTVILVMGAQNDALKQQALGASSDPVVTISNNIASAGIEFDTLREELLRQPHVKTVTATLFQPWSFINSCLQEIVSASADRSARRWEVCGNNVQYDFFSTFDLQVLAGRAFARDRGDDVANASSGVKNVVIDRILAEEYGWRPEQAVGQTIHMTQFANPAEPFVSLRVIGVVEARPLAAIGLGARSTMYLLAPGVATIPSVRIARSDIPAALREIESAWQKLAPQVALKWRFTDDLLNDSYAMFRAVSGGFGALATLALAIAILGLIGMALHVIGRRTHEIGVRKTLGASVHGIVGMLLKDFSKPVVVANLIAWPLAFGAAQIYLNLFVQRISLSPTPFLLSLIFTVFIAWVAVAGQAMQAALLKPAKVLRYE